LIRGYLLGELDEADQTAFEVANSIRCGPSRMS
jgi:hypothetical protein